MVFDLPTLPAKISTGQRGEARLFAEITAKAFAKDPFNLWVFGKPNAMRPTFHVEAAHTYLPHGLCYRIGEQAAAMWMLPKTLGGRSTDIPMRAMPGLIMILLRYGGIGAVRRAAAADRAMKANKPTEPHLYLFTIGVTPDAQGQGFGHQLLSPLLRAADRAGLPIYLESSNPANHDFYAGHGFETHKIVYARPDAPPLETMWRYPQ